MRVRSPNRPSPCRLVWGLVALALMPTACFGNPALGGDDLAARCGQGLTLFENARCNGPADARMKPAAHAELERMRMECKDPASRQRIAQLEQSCLPRYDDAVDAVRADRRAIRAKFLSAVSDLLVDPEYPPAFDAYKDAEELGVRGDPRAEAELRETRARLVDLARKHGVAPEHAKELELW